jgi:hypothetical protein
MQFALTLASYFYKKKKLFFVKSEKFREMRAIKKVI